MAGNNDVRDNLLIEAAALHVTIAPGASAGSKVLQQPCLRDNECSRQQLVRLVGYRGPSVDTAASWDRLRRQQAAIQAG